MRLNWRIRNGWRTDRGSFQVAALDYQRSPCDLSLQDSRLRQQLCWTPDLAEQSGSLPSTRPRLPVRTGRWMCQGVGLWFHPWPWRAGVPEAESFWGRQVGAAIVSQACALVREFSSWNNWVTTHGKWGRSMRFLYISKYFVLKCFIADLPYFTSMVCYTNFWKPAWNRNLHAPFPLCLALRPCPVTVARRPLDHRPPPGREVRCLPWRPALASERLFQGRGSAGLSLSPQEFQLHRS